MQSNLEINVSYAVWKEKYLADLKRDNSGRHGFQNNFYGNLLVETLEKAYPDFLSIQANKQFTSLINIYSFELRAAYGYEWDQSKVEASNHPKFLEFMEKLTENGFLFKPEIKKFAPLLAQTTRTSRDSFFGKLPQDCLDVVANWLEPQLSLVDVSEKKKTELQKAEVFYDKIRLFSYDANNIAFSRESGTQVTVTAYEPFKQWFAELPLRQNMPLNTNHGMFKINETTLAINSGPNTPGIQIQKRGDVFIVCNNLTADKMSNIAPEQLTQARETNLINLLVALKQTLQAEPKIAKTVTQEEQEPPSEEKCSIQ